MLFDTHCHLYDEGFDEDREGILDDMEAQGITPCVLVGADMPSSRVCQAMARRKPWLYFSAAIHPHDAKDYDAASHAELEALMRDPKCVAWGETGLDYYYDYSPRDAQREALERQLDAAAALAKPVIFHVRDAHGDIMDILSARRGSLPRGVMHCYSGSIEMAEELIKLGMYVGLGGVVTFKNARKAAEVAKSIPIECLLLETDAPYMAPEPYRGQRCDSSQIIYIAEKIAALRGVNPEDILQQTAQNACELFGIKL